MEKKNCSNSVLDYYLDFEENSTLLTTVFVNIKMSSYLRNSLCTGPDVKKRCIIFCKDDNGKYPKMAYTV